ncbi:MAG: autotransporter-associated beta strand repeat-containing protein, partial [Chthoniobacterales bacterium]
MMPKSCDSSGGFLTRVVSFLVLLGSLALPVNVEGQTTFNYIVSTSDQLSAALTQATANMAGNSKNLTVITLTGNISATSQMIVNANVNIVGNGNTINMNNADRAFFIAGGTVSINNLSIANGKAQGGNGADGGGGGAGLGGAIFVAAGNAISGSGVTLPTSVTLSRVTFLSNAAVGGAGSKLHSSHTSVHVGAAGGGGGMGGNGGKSYFDGILHDSAGGGGGGFGLGADGGAGFWEFENKGSPGTFVGGASGGQGVGDNGVTGLNPTYTSGGANGGGGGGSQGEGGYLDESNNNGGGGGVSGGDAGTGADGAPGVGGFGGGGGGSGGDQVAAGGFGGGGGGSFKGTGTNSGGFGGGAGNVGYGYESNNKIPGGFGGGDAISNGDLPHEGEKHSGGGAGLGGAVFVMAGAELTIVDPIFMSNSVIPGYGDNGTVYNNGLAAGAAMFLGATTTFYISSNSTSTITGDLGGGAADTRTSGNPANGGGSYSTDPNAQGGIIKTGRGSLILTGSNSYTGGTVISAGELAVGNSGALGTGSVTLTDGTVLASIAGSAITLPNAITVSSGTGMIVNRGASALTLSGSISKANTILVLAGGPFNLTGQITGGNAGTFNSDLVVSNATVTVSATNNNY